MRTITRRLSFVAAVLLLVSACSSGGGASSVPPTDRFLITAEEIEPLPQNMSLNQVIQRLRPQWLSGRGPTNIRGNTEPVIVYLNGSRSTSETLNQMRSGDVRTLQFLDAINATQRFGSGHRSGAIMITTR